MAIARVFAGRPEGAKNDENDHVPTMAVLDGGWVHAHVGRYHIFTGRAETGRVCQSENLTGRVFRYC